MAKGKYTRKQLKRPDEFISMWMRVWEVVQDNAPKVIVMLVVAILIVAGVWTYSYFSETGAVKTTAKLSRAIEIYNQTVIPMETELPPPAKGSAEVPRFKSKKAKLEAADKEFTAAIESARGNLEDVALLMRASVRFDQGRYKDAIADYEKYLGTTKNARLRRAAIEGIAYAHEELKDYGKALEQFRKLNQGAEGKWLATYHEARLLAKQGKKKKAAELLEQVFDKAESQPLQERASDQLAQIEAE